MSDLFKLKTNDFIKGAVTALITGAILSLASAVNQSGFDIFQANWTVIGNTALNAAIATFFGYIVKNFITDQNGKLLGKI